MLTYQSCDSMRLIGFLRLDVFILLSMCWKSDVCATDISATQPTKTIRVTIKHGAASFLLKQIEFTFRRSDVPRLNLDIDSGSNFGVVGRMDSVPRCFGAQRARWQNTIPRA